MKQIFTLFIALFTSLVVLGQTAKISGKISDKESAESVIGAIIQVLDIEPKKATQTDIDGFYSLNNIPVGTYKIKITAIGYQAKEIDNVVLVAGQKLLLDIVLSSQVTETQEVVIVGTIDDVAKENVESLLILQKKTASNVSTISADIIKKLPDRTSGEALRRVSGASLQDGKYVIIRGLNERYNMAMLNGLPLASSESDKKAFSFDLIPANLLDNMVVYKTATPDLPADFAGGIIQVNTKDIPEENSQSISIGGSYNNLTTFKAFEVQNGGKYDFLGFDDGTRKIPAGAPANVDIYDKMKFSEIAENTKLWKHDYSSRRISSVRPSLSLQYNIAKRFQLFKKPTGLLFAVTYNNSPSYTESNTAQLEAPSSLSKYFDEGTYRDNKIYKNTTFLSGLLNFSIKPSIRSNLSIKNFFNINSDQFYGITTAIFRASLEDSVSQNSRNLERALFFSSNKMYNSQLTFDYLLPLNIKAKVLANFTSINREIPDYRKYVYNSYKEENQDDGSYFYNQYKLFSAAGVSNFAQNTGRFFQFLKEYNYNIAYDFTIPVKKIFTDFKVGALHQKRVREVDVRTFAYDIFYNTGTLSIDKILVNDNFIQTKIMMREKETNFYNSSSILNSFFTMATITPYKWLKIVGGVRNERYVQNIKTYVGYDVDKTDKTNFYLPSTTVILSPNAKQNIKLSYSQTLCRPEFRELAPIQFYDYINNIVFQGNTSLKITEIENFDFKYEYYLKPGEFFSINPFYKSFKNPTELFVLQAEAPNVRYETKESAKLLGLEIEARKKIAKNFTISGNYTLVNSEIKADGLKRSMQGQSPYVINAMFNYENIKYKFDIALSYNEFGDRLAYDGQDYSRLVFEKGRQMFDFQVGKKFYKDKLHLRYIASNIFHQPYILYNDINADKKYTAGVDIDFNKTLLPSSHSISVSCKF